MQRITPFLWFDNQAEEAAKFYTSIFKNSKIGKIARYVVWAEKNFHVPNEAAIARATGQKSGSRNEQLGKKFYFHPLRDVRYDRNHLKTKGPANRIFNPSGSLGPQGGGCCVFSD